MKSDFDDRVEGHAAIIVFAKVPEAGKVKTRLSPELSPEAACKLYRAFLHDALDQYAKLNRTVRLYLAPSEALLDGVPEGLSLHEQIGNNLGERMLHALNETCEAGNERAIIIGTDHPTLPSSYLIMAERALQSGNDLCIGPARDGGYYLIGANAPVPDVFTGMSYSHDDVFRDTIRLARTQELDVAILPSWYDVDTFADLARLSQELRENQSVAVRTAAALSDLNAI